MKPTIIDQSLSEVFDVEPNQTQENVPAVVESEIKIPDTATVENDAAAVRDVLYGLLKKGEDAFTNLHQIAKAEESPRSFEVLNSMLSNLSDIAVKLMDVHEKQAKLTKAKDTESGNVNNGTVNNNTVFVGTTAELQQVLKNMNEKP